MIKIRSSNKSERVKLDINSIYQGHHKTTYKGVKAIRCPFDYLIYQMILFEIKPDLVIEVGTNKGGGALYIADILELIGKGMVHTIDIVDDVDPLVKSHERINFFFDGWEAYDLNLVKDYKKILLIEDASHKYEDTIGIINKFNDVVSVDSYMIIEDGIVNELGMEHLYNGGPLKAIREFLSKNDSFTIDRKWCDMFGINATFNVNGYLKKIK